MNQRRPQPSDLSQSGNPAFQGRFYSGRNKQQITPKISQSPAPQLSQKQTPYSQNRFMNYQSKRNPYFTYQAISPVYQGFSRNQTPGRSTRN